eukprot:2403222-Pyramimonas_sp.AAC.1
MQMTKCIFEYTVAAVEFVFPRLRRRLTWSHSVTDAWRVAAEVKHRLGARQPTLPRSTLHVG